MTRKDYFILTIQIIGLILVLYGLRYVIDFPLGVLGYFTLQKTDYSYYLIIGLCHLFMGMYFLRGAPYLVSFAFPGWIEKDNSPESEEELQNKTESGQTKN
jgi:hypothetical protein